MKTLISLGVDGMFTNFPDLLRELTVPNTGGPPLSPRVALAAIATGGALGLFGWLLLRERASRGA